MFTDINHSIIDQFLWKVLAEWGFEMSIIADCRSSLPLATTLIKLPSYLRLLSDRVKTQQEKQTPFLNQRNGVLYPSLFGAAFFSFK